MQAEPRGLVEASASLRCRSALLTESAKGPKAADEGRTSFVRFAQEIRHYAARFVFDEASVRAYWRLLAASPRGRTFARNSEGVPQALGDRVNGDVVGKSIQCSCLVKGLFRPTNSWSISFWASLSFCALGFLRGREGSFTRTQRIGGLGSTRHGRGATSIVPVALDRMSSDLADYVGRHLASAQSSRRHSNLESLSARTVGIPLWPTRRASAGDGNAR